MKILVTGTAGFIGSHLAHRLLDRGDEVVGFDNLNDYYDVTLKQARLARLQARAGYTHVAGDLADRAAVETAFAAHKPQRVVNLAAQAGVRYAAENPHVYVQSNVVGFLHVLEGCRHHGVEHLVYASTSSVYGANTAMPFSEHASAEHPLTLYAASKKANEQMAHSYSHLYGIPTTGLRFFTVYGPAGRPDMAYYSFTKKILAGEPIAVFNNGDLRRDFTYVDDIVTGMLNMLKKPPQAQDGQAPAKVYNIGNNQPVQLMHFIHALEAALSKAYGRELTATMEFKPMQAGDVYQTYADVDELIRDFGFHPNTSIEDGLYEFAKWYRDYYGDNG